MSAPELDWRADGHGGEEALLKDSYGRLIHLGLTTPRADCPRELRLGFVHSDRRIQLTHEEVRELIPALLAFGLEGRLRDPRGDPEAPDGMTVLQLLLELLGRDPGSRVLLSGDPFVLGDGLEVRDVDDDVPGVSNTTSPHADLVILWPTHSWEASPPALRVLERDPLEETDVLPIPPTA